MAAYLFRISVPHRGFAIVTKGLRYAHTHEWVKVDGNAATVGIGDGALRYIGHVVEVRLPEVGARVSQGSSFGKVIADVDYTKNTYHLYSPVCGTIVEVNDELVCHPQLLNLSTYEKGWIMKVEMKDASEPEELMDADKYSEFSTEEVAEIYYLTTRC